MNAKTARYWAGPCRRITTRTVSPQSRRGHPGGARPLPAEEYDAALGRRSSINGATAAWRIPTEPGSTFKALVLAMALEDGVVNENSTFYCRGSTQVALHHFTATRPPVTARRPSRRPCRTPATSPLLPSVRRSAPRGSTTIWSVSACWPKPASTCRARARASSGRAAISPAPRARPRWPWPRSARPRNSPPSSSLRLTPPWPTAAIS